MAEIYFNDLTSRSPRSLVRFSLTAFVFLANFGRILVD
jgi:hypothetical protein